MASIINADTSDGLKITSDTSGQIDFQSAGVTKAGVNATGLTGDGSQLTGLPAASSLTTASGAAPSYSARAWVNFNGLGVVAIRASGNVSSITDNGVGDYTVNFTTALPDVNYSVAGSVAFSVAGFMGMLGIETRTATKLKSSSQVRITVRHDGNTVFDQEETSVGIFR